MSFSLKIVSYFESPTNPCSRAKDAEAKGEDNRGLEDVNHMKQRELALIFFS